MANKFDYKARLVVGSEHGETKNKGWSAEKDHQAARLHVGKFPQQTKGHIR